MATYNALLQGLQVGGGLANTALDAIAARDRIKLGEKELGQRAEDRALARAQTAAQFAWEKQKFEEDQNRRRQDAIIEAIRRQNDEDRAIAGMSPDQIQQLNLIRQARAAQAQAQANQAAMSAYENRPVQVDLTGSGGPSGGMPQASNAKVTIGKNGMQYSGTMADMMIDSQNPHFAPILNHSLQNTLQAQTGTAGELPIAPMAMNRFQNEQDAKAQELSLKLKADARAERDANRADKAAALDPLKLKLQAAGLKPEEVANYNAMGGGGMGVLPDQIPVANVAPKLDEHQSLALGFAKRMALAENELKNVLGGDKPYDPTGAAPYFQGFGAYPEWLKSQEYKRFEQAAKNWSAAALRKESGAAISQSEYTGAMQQYFPQVNDSPEVIQQKNNARKAYFESLIADLPPYYRNQVLGESSQPPAESSGMEGLVIHQDGNNYIFKNGRYVPMQ